MNRVAAAFLVCLLPQSPARAAEPRARDFERSIRVEAARLARSVPTTEWRVQPGQAPAASDTRNWCRRHPVGCGALLGLAGGFGVGVAYEQGSDPCCTRVGFGLIFGGPIGAAVGAATGAVISVVRK
jgi:hypothetical protein